MVTPVTSSYVKPKPTFFKAVRGDQATFASASNIYVDVPNIGTIASVPDDAKLIWFPTMIKSVTGNGFARITDGTNTFKEITTVPGTTYNTPEIDGTVLQNSGGAATVKIQAKSDDANTVVVNENRNSFIATDGDTPITIAGPSPATTFTIPFRASVSDLYLFYTNNIGIDTDSCMINGSLIYHQTVTDNSEQSASLTVSYATENTTSQFILEVEDLMIAGDYLVWDWAGHGVNWV